ncbi:TolC family protein [Stenotrophomonas sp. PS02298]|uniref:TolC family protein n=1 Tax=Stenotrophomonas sp. PS02298 TaxID=2991424 RepID=UPI00249B7D45|nr:TolC family protein [Stenotrophomonas sp. PS02298]
MVERERDIESGKPVASTVFFETTVFPVLDVNTTLRWRMSNSDKDAAFYKKSGAWRLLVIYLAGYLASVVLSSGPASAGNELLQFEQASLEGRRADVDACAQCSAAQRGGLAKGVMKESPAPAIDRPVRDSLASPVLAGLEEDVLVYERLRYASVDSPERLDEAASAEKGHQITVIAKLGFSSPLQGVSTTVASAAGRGLVPEAELRDLFLSMVDAAAIRSPAVAGALAQRAASNADVSEAKGQRYPQLNISGRGLSRELGSATAIRSRDFSLSLGMTTTLFDWGRIRRTIESRGHLVDAADFAVQAQLESSAYDVTSNLVELAKQRIVVEASQRYVDRMAELVKMLEGIVAMDVGRASELTQARARLLQAEASRSTADARSRDIEISLRRMVGDRPLPGLPGSQYWDIRLPELTRLLVASQHHPTVLQARASARSADLQADAVRSALLPQVNWVVSKDAGDGSYGRESAWQTGLSLSWSAYRGGSGRSSELAARQRAQAGWMAAEQQAQDLEHRIRAANHDARSFADRADLYRGLSLESNKIRAAFYEQWYHLGRRTLLDVLSSESEHYNNQVAEISSRFDGYQAVIRQYASAGVLVGWLSAGD